MSGSHPETSILFDPGRALDVDVFRHEAMGTTFELWIHEGGRRYAEQAAQAAFELLERLEQWLSRYRSNSDIARVNRGAGHHAVTVNPRTFCLLRRCLELQELTEGAFDVTATLGVVAPDRSSLPSLRLDAAKRTAILTDVEAELDLGGIGKGYALDKMAAVLKDWDLNRALLISGGSSVLAMEAPPDRVGWPVLVEGADEPWHLCHQGLGASGQARGPHIVDPRTGRITRRRASAWCVASDAATADALSTACMILDEVAVARVCDRLGAAAG